MSSALATETASKHPARAISKRFRSIVPPQPGDTPSRTFPVDSVEPYSSVIALASAWVKTCEGQVRSIALPVPIAGSSSTATPGCAGLPALVALRDLGVGVH